MRFNIHPTLLALIFPFALLLLGQDGSCRQQEQRQAPSERKGTAAVTMPTNKNENGRVDREAAEAMQQSKASDDMPKGMWGGNHVRLEVQEGEARIEFDCAHGTLGNIAPDSAGNFDVAGTFVAERGGPVRVGETGDGRPARFRGSVSDKTLTLKVTLTDTGDEVGTFTLTHGKSVRLTKCL
ncbi:MAG: hypothetical protein H7Z38_24210 [Rubrivivax sp.]|nr:hypothetical protein [Pyrinomonadaceae bacterium]